jgi:hypothetical protein
MGMRAARPRATADALLVAVKQVSIYGGSLCAVSIGAGWAWAWLSLPVSVQTTHCEATMMAEHTPTQSSILARRPSIRMRDRNGNDETLRSKLMRALRIIRRLCKLAFVFTPVVALYPLHWITSRTRMALVALQGGSTSDTDDDDAHQMALQAIMLGDDASAMYVGWYYQLCLYCVEWSGAAMIKIMQWAGSRPDMFGREFCAVFSKLQDSTRPHAWKHTEQAMIEAFGEDWETKIQLEGGKILGSGCIAQVYKGVILDGDGVNNGTNNGANNGDNGKKQERPVAVKVMHPNVEDDIDADLDIMRLSIGLLENFGPFKDLKWLNLPGFIEEMAIMLKTQLDLRKEGEHLVQFNKNFEGNPTIIFPKLIEGYEPTPRVLCETFCEGVPLIEFVKNNKADQKLLTKMCQEAIKAVCQMIFLGMCSKRNESLLDSSLNDQFALIIMIYSLFGADRSTMLTSFFSFLLRTVAINFCVDASDNFTHGDLHPGNVLVTSDCKFV